MTTRKQVAGFAGIWQWAVTTIISACAMAIGFATYVHNFVYPRKEGEKLERQVENVEKRSVENSTSVTKQMTEQNVSVNGRLSRMEDEYRSDLRHIRDKLDDLFRVATEPPPGKSRIDGAFRPR